MPFELESPAGLWLLTLLAPLILLYVLKVRRQRVVVASTWLWAAAARDLLAKTPFRKLIASVPLLLQLLALVLLALAASRPALRGAAMPGDRVALVIDTSASMNALAPDGTPRIVEAREAAAQVLRTLSPGAEAMIVDAGREARIASPLDRDTRRLTAALDAVQAGEVEGNLGAAVAVATDRLRRLPGDNRIVVITDEALAQPNALASVTLPTRVIKVGAALENAAVTRVDVRSGVDPATNRQQVQAFAVIGNYGATKRELYVTLSQKNVSEPLAARKLELGPGEHSPVVLTFEPAPGDVGTGLVVQLSPTDAMPTDDFAYARVPPGRAIPVVMAPADASPWVQRALLADPDVELLGTSLEGLSTADVPTDALVVVEGACPPAVPGGDLLVLNPPPGRCRTAVVGNELEALSVTSWKRSDARLRFLTLDGVELLSARHVETEGPADALIRTRQGVVAADISLPGRTGTLLAFDVGDSNWPLRASFVLFVRNLVELARVHRARGITGPARTGSPLRVLVPPGITDVTVETPNGESSHVAARDGLAIVPDVRRAGFYHLSWQGERPGSVLVPANLASEAESDTRPRPLPHARGSVEVTTADATSSLSSYGWLLALLALLLVAADVWWLTRRPRRCGPELMRSPRLPDRVRVGEGAR